MEVARRRAWPHQLKNPQIHSEEVEECLPHFAMQWKWQQGSVMEVARREASTAVLKDLRTAKIQLEVEEECLYHSAMQMQQLVSLTGQLNSKGWQLFLR
jgi:hypothetical protein